MTVKSIGIIGLGVIGAPMASNLLRAGFQVTGFNRSRPAVDVLVGQGGTAAASVADLTARSDAVLTVLPDTPDVELVVLGEDGVLANALSGQLLVDFSTIRPDAARRVAQAARSAGMRPLDAPVSGGEQSAIDATLSVMVGGLADDVAYARPILDAVGKTIVHVGPDGSGQTVKAANQLIVAGNILLVAEAIALLNASGVAPEPAVAVLAGGLAGSRVLDQKAGKMLSGDFRPGFRIDLHHKDMGIALSVGRGAGVSLPVTGIVSQLVAAARAQGHGALDHSALYMVIQALAGGQGVAPSHTIMDR